MRLAHLSDLHFGAAPKAAIEMLQDDLQRQGPDLVIVTGDLTQFGTHQEFQQARKFLDELDAHCMVVPGNHDVPSRSPLTRLLRPYARFRQHIDSTLEPQRIVGNTAIAGINSARRARLGWNWSLGSISRRQADRTVDFLQNASAAYRVVALHHPLIRVGAGEASKSADGSGRLLQRLLASGVDLVLCGHSHRPLVTELRDGTSDELATVIVQSSTGTSSRQRGHGNGYTLLELRPHGELRIQPRQATHDGFQACWERAYARDVKPPTTSLPAAAISGR
jgi:3',5'-cyclic AMP phosphodiesterase CpdA